GFAVVASEVKALANQTAKATEEIAQQVGEIQTSTRGAVEAIRNITSAISDMTEVTSAIAAAVEEQDATTGEITQAVSRAASQSQQALERVESVTGQIERTNQESDNVNAVSQYLQDAAKELADDIEGFLANIAQEFEDRRQVGRDEINQRVKVRVEGHEHETTLYDKSENGGYGIGSVPGLTKGAVVELLLAEGVAVPVRVQWVAEKRSGLKRLDEVTEMSAA
ncbi:MAG: hypothetical protein KDJ16_17750, partial [Hyphomicrobiales bacterium]|nr:hypothetical protein [Hyphomicrobiales bacterium]